MPPGHADIVPQQGPLVVSKLSETSFECWDAKISPKPAVAPTREEAIAAYHREHPCSIGLPIENRDDPTLER